MKTLVTGAKGQLGSDIVKELTARGVKNKGVDIGDFDITDKHSVFAAISKYQPTAVIHCAAYTAVDKAEEEPELCRKVNEDGTRHIAKACKDIRAKMLYISTDYVFAGVGSEFHKPDDKCSPLSVYGKTKLAGERAVIETLDRYFIIRTSWVFGQNGGNFVKTMLRLGKERELSREQLNVVSDQFGSPTYTFDLAPLICDMAQSEKFGIYHATNEGTCSWAEFAAEIFKLANINVKVNPIPSEQYSAKAARPKNSRLCKENLDMAGFKRLPHWKDSLERYAKCNYSQPCHSERSEESFSAANPEFSCNEILRYAQDDKLG